MATETTQQESTEAQAPTSGSTAPAKPKRTRSSGSAKKAAPKKAAAKSSGKKASSKSAAKKASSKKASTPRSSFPELKTEAACEKVMKANLESYKQYQVERDKNRNEKGMEKHRLGYRTYKNAYTQLLGLRKAAGKGRRNAKAAS